MAQIPYKFYTTAVNGRPEVISAPGTNTPYGHQETDFSGALSSLSSGYQHDYNRVSELIGRYGMEDVQRNMPDLYSKYQELPKTISDYQGITSRYKSGGLTSADYDTLAKRFGLSAADIQAIAGGGSAGSGVFSGPITEKNTGGFYSSEEAANPSEAQKSYNEQLATAMQSGQQPQQVAPGVANPYLGQNLNIAGDKQESKFQKGFQQANEDLGGKALDVAGPQGTSLVNMYSPPKRNDTSSWYVQSDPIIGGLVKTWQDYINPANQRTSLADTYKQMVKDSGIQDIDMELVDMKNVIEGSEDDLRTEITKAGGFATESQVRALTNARNKQLIKNYNTLLDQRNAKEKYLQTSLQLEQADRQAADQRFESMFNMGSQLATLQNQMQSNARQQMQWLAGQVGFDGLYDSTGGDPYYASLIEQTLGLPQGGLLSSANQARLARAQAQQEASLDLQLKQQQIKTPEQLKMEAERDRLDNELKNEQIRTERARRALIGQPKTEIVDVGGRKFLVNSTTGATIREISPGGNATDDNRRLQSLDTLTKIDDIQNHPGLNNAVGPGGIFKMFSRFGTPLTGSKQSFIGDVQNIVSNMTLNKLIEAKSQGATFGALSDGELRMLGDSATKIGTWAKKNDQGEVIGYSVGEKAFRKELDNIRALTARSYILSGYKPEDVGAVQTSDGKVWLKNNDGTMTQVN